jgi:hypothetical protein
MEVEGGGEAVERWDEARPKVVLVGDTQVGASWAWRACSAVQEVSMCRENYIKFHGHCNKNITGSASYVLMNSSAARSWLPAVVWCGSQSPCIAKMFPAATQL